VKDDHFAAWKSVNEAYSKAGHDSFRAADPMQTATLCGLVLSWLETFDAGFMDAALIYCDFHDLPILPELRKYMADAASYRNKGKSFRANREGIKTHALRAIANLHIRGVTVERAAEVSAVWSSGTEHPLKASSLEREYSKVWRKGTPTKEDKLRQFRNEFPDPQTDAKWLKLLETLPPPTPEQKGERR
jgi:hypothetical protein